MSAIIPKAALCVMTGIVLGTLVGGCGQEGFHQQGSAPSMGTEIRSRLPFVHIPGLTVTLEISGIGTFPMTVNLDSTVSATVPGIPAGWQTFTITYYFGTCNDNPTILAVASLSAQVIAGQTIAVAFLPQDLDRNFDDDLDGWVNLAEVLLGTDPCSAVSFPPGDDPSRTLLTAGGSVQSASSATTIHDSVGEAVEGGSSTSNSYTVTGGFLAYP